MNVLNLEAANVNSIKDETVKMFLNSGQATNFCQMNSVLLLFQHCYRFQHISKVVAWLMKFPIDKYNMVKSHNTCSVKYYTL